ncbi:hypothetical protein O3G_MSEX000640 [Manduca sexta]|nr:hypothetical protein O3G_MSEX000640 [Manduca sexta]
MAENFDFETALDLLPVMTREDTTTIELITNIDFYNSLLNEKSKPILINFVLKTRLTTVAKFYLKENYSYVQDLLSDMVHYLLPKKIQIELENSLNFNKQANIESNMDHSHTILAHQNKVSNSECISQDQQSSHYDLSECIDLNILNNSVMKSDPSPVCDNTQVDIFTDVNVCNENKFDVVTGIQSSEPKKELIEPNEKIDICKDNILILKQPQAGNVNQLEKGIVNKKSKDTELILGNNIEDCSESIVLSNEGFCIYIPSNKKLYLDLQFLAIGKNFIRDVEVFCRNINIKELKINKNRSNRKDIKKFIRVIRKYNIGYPRIKLNTEFINIMKVEKVTSKYSRRNNEVKNKNNDIKMSTNVETMNNEKKKVKLLKSIDKWSSKIIDNINDENNKDIVSYIIKSEKSTKVYFIDEEYKEKYFVKLCEMYDKRSVGIT